MAGGADADDVDGVAFDFEAARNFLLAGLEAEGIFVDVGYGLALRADEVVVGVGVDFDAEGAVMQADLFEDSAGDEEVDIFVDGGERDGGDALFDAGVDFFRAGVAGHGLHDVVEDLALVGCGEAVAGAEVAEGGGCGLERG